MSSMWKRAVVLQLHSRCDVLQWITDKSYECWANDPVQRDDYDYWGGANDLSVNQAREAYKAGKKVY